MLQPAILLPKVRDFRRRGLARGILTQPFLPSFEKLFAPPVGEIRVQTFATTQGRDTLLPPHPFEDNPDLFFGQEAASGLPSDVLNDLLC